MAFWGDYHTHTTYSHGKGTVEDNVLAAIALGLKAIGITDHGFHHMTYNVRRMDWPYIIADVEQMRKKYPMIDIRLGLETNFIARDGHIDIMPSDMRYLDMLICGYHKFVKPYKLGDVFNFWIPNFVLSTFHKSNKKRTAKNTDTFIKAIEKYDIDIVSHPGLDAKVDIRELAKAAVHYGTYLELNCKSKHKGVFSMTDAEIEAALEEGANFVVDSDAHSPAAVGKLDAAVALIERIKIPYERIANWEAIPSFRSRRSVGEKHE